MSCYATPTSNTRFMLIHSCYHACISLPFAPVLVLLLARLLHRTRTDARWLRLLCCLARSRKAVPKVLLVAAWPCGSRTETVPKVPLLRLWSTGPCSARLVLTLDETTEIVGGRACTCLDGLTELSCGKLSLTGKITFAQL